MPIQSPGYGLYTYDDTPQDPENKPVRIHQSWMEEPKEFKPMLKVEISTGKILLDNTAKLKEFEEVRSKMTRAAHNAIPVPPKEELVELIKKHSGKLNCIAKEKGVSWPVVRKWVKQFDLEVMAQKLKLAKQTTPLDPPDADQQNKDVLKRLDELKRLAQTREPEQALETENPYTEELGARIEYEGKQDRLEFPSVGAAVDYIRENCSWREAQKIKIFRTKLIKEEVPFTFETFVFPGGKGREQLGAD